jgi:hypothetical protein
MTRDQKVAGDIENVQNLVKKLERNLNMLKEHAQAEEAEAHANLYERVQEELWEAWKHLDEAWEVMAHGDAEDYE